MYLFYDLDNKYCENFQGILAFYSLRVYLFRIEKQHIQIEFLRKFKYSNKEKATTLTTRKLERKPNKIKTKQSSTHAHTPINKTKQNKRIQKIQYRQVDFEGRKVGRGLISFFLVIFFLFFFSLSLCFCFR